MHIRKEGDKIQEMIVQNHVNLDFEATYGNQLIFHTGLDGSGLAG